MYVCMYVCLLKHFIIEIDLFTDVFNIAKFNLKKEEENNNNNNNFLPY